MLSQQPLSVSHWCPWSGREGRERAGSPGPGREAVSTDSARRSTEDQLPDPTSPLPGCAARGQATLGPAPATLPDSDTPPIKLGARAGDPRQACPALNGSLTPSSYPQLLFLSPQPHPVPCRVPCPPLPCSWRPAVQQGCHGLGWQLARGALSCFSSFLPCSPGDSATQLVFPDGTLTAPAPRVQNKAHLSAPGTQESKYYCPAGRD